MKYYTRRPSRRKGGALPLAALPLFDWASRSITPNDPVVRYLMRKTRVSPALALVFAELSGLGGRHDR